MIGRHAECGARLSCPDHTSTRQETPAMSRWTPAPVRPWQTLRRNLARIVAPVAGRARRTLARSLPAATRAPHPTGDSTMSDTSDHQHTEHATDQRHLRIGRGAWRDAATRAREEGRALAELVTALADAYGAGAIALPGAAADESTAVRHVRVGRAPWQAAADRARADGRGPADVLAELVAAYGAGAIGAPAAAPIRMDVRPGSGDRTDVRPSPRGSNACSTDPPDPSPAATPRPTTRTLR